jgi:hypothetical protein
VSGTCLVWEFTGLQHDTVVVQTDTIYISYYSGEHNCPCNMHRI